MNECKISRWAILKNELSSLTPAAFLAQMRQFPDAILLDCRTPSEFASGCLPNAINFNYLSQDFVGEMNKLDPDKKYLVYCRSERRSIRTCMLLKNGGFTDVHNLDGGLNSWFKTFNQLEPA